MLIASFIRMVRGYFRYRATVAALGALDAATLRDIGLNRSQIESVARNSGC